MKFCSSFFPRCITVADISGKYHSCSLFYFVPLFRGHFGIYVFDAILCRIIRLEVNIVKYKTIVGEIKCVLRCIIMVNLLIYCSILLDSNKLYWYFRLNIMPVKRKLQSTKHFHWRKSPHCAWSLLICGEI